MLKRGLGMSHEHVRMALLAVTNGFHRMANGLGHSPDDWRSGLVRLASFSFYGKRRRSQLWLRFFMQNSRFSYAVIQLGHHHLIAKRQHHAAALDDTRIDCSAYSISRETISEKRGDVGASRPASTGRRHDRTHDHRATAK
jgi:hypothetical protein